MVVYLGGGQYERPRGSEPIPNVLSYLVLAATSEPLTNIDVEVLDGKETHINAIFLHRNA
jgi:hypothetical protein